MKNSNKVCMRDHQLSNVSFMSDTGVASGVSVYVGGTKLRGLTRVKFAPVEHSQFVNASFEIEGIRTDTEAALNRRIDRQLEIFFEMVICDVQSDNDNISVFTDIVKQIMGGEIKNVKTLRTIYFSRMEEA